MWFGWKYDEIVLQFRWSIRTRDKPTINSTSNLIQFSRFTKPNFNIFKTISKCIHNRICENIQKHQHNAQNIYVYSIVFQQTLNAQNFIKNDNNTAADEASKYLLNIPKFRQTQYSTKQNKTITKHLFWIHLLPPYSIHLSIYSATILFSIKFPFNLEFCG